MGQTSEKIFDCVKEEMEKENKVLPIYVVDNLDDAIKTARKYAKTFSNRFIFLLQVQVLICLKNAVQRGELFGKKSKFIIM